MASYPIDTEEGQRLELELAGLGSRAAAGALDLLGCMVVVFLALIVLGIVSAVDPTYMSDFVIGLLLGAGVALPSLWQLAFALRRVATPGKRSLGLAVIDRSGAPATLAQHALRALLLPIELLPLPLPIGLMVIFGHPESRRLGDLVAGTLVTRSRVRPAGTWQVQRRRRRLDPQLVEGYADELTPARLARLGPAEHTLLIDLSGRAGLRSRVREDLELRIANHLAKRFDLRPPESPAAFLEALGRSLEPEA